MYLSDLADLIWIILPLFILQFGLMIAAICSIVRKKVPGSDKTPWILIVVFVGTIGSIIYFIVGSSKLDEKAARLEDMRDNQ